MKTQKLIFFMTLVGAASAFQSCTRNGNDVWEDSKSAGRHMSRGVRSLGGKHGDSRQIRSRHDFEYIENGRDFNDSRFPQADYEGDEYGNDPYSASEYVPLDVDDSIAMADISSRQPRETPGEAGSSIPGIRAFRDPNTIPQMAGIFRNIYFEYDSSLVKGAENLGTIHAIADYLRRNPNVYVFLEGHTDERGPQAYNLALGSRRSNATRNLLIGEGVGPDRLFTVSHGKERPLTIENNEQGWSKNRRVEFKVYVR